MCIRGIPRPPAGRSKPSCASNFGDGDYFGFSLAISGDGNTLLIGAPRESSDATGVGPPRTNNNLPNSGAAYVIRIQQRTRHWR